MVRRLRILATAGALVPGLVSIANAAVDPTVKAWCDTTIFVLVVVAIILAA